MKVASVAAESPPLSPLPLSSRSLWAQALMVRAAVARRTTGVDFRMDIVYLAGVAFGRPRSR
ncbi:hypothetical protein GCM10009633_06410 [Janibacter melonis]